METSTEHEHKTTELMPIFTTFHKRAHASCILSPNLQVLNFHATISCPPVIAQIHTSRRQILKWGFFFFRHDKLTDFPRHALQQTLQMALNFEDLGRLTQLILLNVAVQACLSDVEELSRLQVEADCSRLSAFLCLQSAPCLLGQRHLDQLLLMVLE
eukprot:1146161-Pelagomonas_calceolata.AAC.3